MEGLKKLKLLLFIVAITNVTFGMLRNIPVYRVPVQTGMAPQQGNQYQFDMPKSQVTAEQKDQIMSELLEDEQIQQDLLQNRQSILKNNFQQPQEVKVLQKNVQSRQSQEEVIVQPVEVEYLIPETKSTKKHSSSLANFFSQSSSFGAIRRFNKSDKIDSSYKGFRTDIGPLKNIGIRYFGELPLFVLSQKETAKSSAKDFDIYYPLLGEDLRGSSMGITIVNEVKWRPDLSFASYIIDLEIFNLYSKVIRSFDSYVKILNLKQEFRENLFDKYLKLINEFNNNYFKRIEEILLTSGLKYNIIKNKKLIIAYKIILGVYQNNPRALGHYYYLSMVLNEMLYCIYYNNMREVIIKKIIDQNPQKNYSLKNITYFGWETDFNAPFQSKALGIYNPTDKTINLAELSCPAKDLFTLRHELQHAAQIEFDVYDSFEKGLAEDDAERTAAEQTKCATCLKIVQSTRFKGNSNTGYFNLYDFDPYVEKCEKEGMYCRAHQIDQKLREEIEKIAKEIRNEKNQFRIINLKEKMILLDKQTGTLFDHFLKI